MNMFCTEHEPVLFKEAEYLNKSSWSLSGPCCPSGIKLYMLASNSLRVYWRSTASSRRTTVEMLGTSSNYTCTASPGENSCNVENIQCGDVYRLVVAPLTAEGSKIPFCPYRLYSGTTDRIKRHYCYLCS